MSETGIKICGLKRMQDIECVNACKPDYIGFVFFSKSSRLVSIEEAACLKKQLSSDIKAVGVFLENEYDEIIELVNRGIIDIIQVHGSRNREMIPALKAEVSVPIVEAFSIDSTEDVELANQSIADFVLLDHGAGGGGETFDWSLLAGINRPYFLAGGLNPANVKTAISLCNPYAVDVSSGVETDKLKDPEKIREFINIVRAM